jgi:hypothetical protein
MANSDPATTERSSASRRTERSSSSQGSEWQVDRTSQVFRWCLDSHERCYRLYHTEKKWHFYRQSGNSLKISTPDGVSWHTCDKCVKCKEYPKCSVWPACPNCSMCSSWPGCSTRKSLPENPLPESVEVDPETTRTVLSLTPTSKGSPTYLGSESVHSKISLGSGVSKMSRFSPAPSPDTVMSTPNMTPKTVLSVVAQVSDVLRGSD